MLQEFKLFNGSLENIDHSKKLITTLNAPSFKTLKKDSFYRDALKSSDML